ncbi:MAG: hypothetical protein K5681_07065 [Treponema sp.]|nr:hypothetical protein [Treponema sp.]
MKSPKSLVFVLIFFVFTGFLWAGNSVLAHPRRVYLVKTQHFEILFPKESAESAKYIADIVDAMYEKAKAAVNYQYDFSMPIIISPDSEVLKVKYTTQPYNRIVVFDAVPVAGGASLESLLYHEIFKAISTSVRSPLNHFIYKTVGGDGFQPISLMYLPFTFVEGYVKLASSEAIPLDFNDSYYQQLLIQAKIENKFPSWFQAAVLRDIHPGTDLSYAAANGFAAYLMSEYGVEKYMEFWNECGKLHLILTDGIFYKIFGKSIYAAWEDFKDSIPMPEYMEKMNIWERQTQELIEHDSQGLFEHIFYTNYGIVWYDGIRHEVDIFDLNGNLKIRQLLFIAEDISYMALSPDRRYLAISFTRSKLRDDFKEVVTHVFDLKEREFLDFKFSLRDSSFLIDDQGKLCLAGLNIDGKVPELQIYSLDLEEEESRLIDYKVFDRKAIPHSFNSAGPGRFVYLLEEEGEQTLVYQSFFEGKIQTALKSFKIYDELGKTIYIDGLRLDCEVENRYTFSFVPEHEGSLVRSGYISLNENYEPKAIMLQDCDAFGGVYYPVFCADRFYYSAKKTSHNELRYLSADSIPYVQAAFEALPEETLAFASATAAAEGEIEGEITSGSQLFSPSDKLLGEYTLKKYNAFKYLMNVSFMPMLAIREISFEDGAFLWPALGLTISSDSDPMRNTEFMLSVGTNFLVVDFEHTINATSAEQKEASQAALDKEKKYSAAAYIKNSSTPIDIEAGAIVNASKKGQYDFTGLAKTSWDIPVGTILRDMDFAISSTYTASTEYYDSNKSEIYPTLSGWTPIWDAYELIEMDATITYSNSHQYGVSKYERRGLTFGGRLYATWDINEMELLEANKTEALQQIENGQESGLTEEEVNALYDEQALDISQVNIGLFASVEIPRLTPLPIINGWVLSLPSTLSLELLNTTGTAMEVNSEILLLGNEIQNGIPLLYLFFSRVGLKAGYNFCLDYDTTSVLLPDIRRDNYLYDIFSQTYIKDSFYLLLNTDFIIPIGLLSKTQFNMNMKAEFFPRSNGFKFSMDVKAYF